jgi:hypothetical protein
VEITIGGRVFESVRTSDPYGSRACWSEVPAEVTPEKEAKAGAGRRPAAVAAAQAGRLRALPGGRTARPRPGDGPPRGV